MISFVDFVNVLIFSWTWLMYVSYSLTALSMMSHRISHHHKYTMEGSFFYQAGRYHRRKSQNRCLQNQKKCRCSGRRSGSSSFSWFICCFYPIFWSSRVWSWKRNRGRPMVFSRSHNNVFSFLVCWYGTCNSDAGDSVFLHMSCGKTQAGGTCVGAWFHFPHTAVGLGSIGKGCNPPLPPVLFHFPHERFNRIHRAPPYWYSSS